MNQLFSITNLKCFYNPSIPPVLDIQFLEIDKGEIVFFLGESGSGKSTILESMGLMNNTVVSKSKINANANFDFFSKENKKISFLDLWKENHEQKLSSLRKQAFSFIFQSNNLFDSLTPVQNVMIPSIVEGNTSAVALKKATYLLDNLLDDVQWRKRQNIKAMSGGQKQRVSFARAISSNYHVLFADEPTGNLDEKNATKVMSLLVDNKKNDQSIIIVSHDIDLSLEFATKIVFIDRMMKTVNNEEYSYGQITSESVFLKTNNKWQNLNMTQSMSDKVFRQFLADKYADKQ